jgi:taurine dioxygenase
MVQTFSSRLAWRQLPLGVEIDHDLSRPLTNEQGRELVRLLWEYNLLLVRGQRLSMERQREICALVGPVLLRSGESGYLSAVPDVETSLSELAWHADAAYTNAPFDALALHAIDVVDNASSTLFVSAERALCSLPTDLQQRLIGRRVDMISPAYDALGGRSCDLPNPTAQKRGEMPAIFRNPHNGRDCVWVSELQAARVIGMEWEDSRELLHEVYDHLYQPDHVFEHRWCNGDLVIWDNIALQHARGSLRNCGKRVLQRVIVGREGVAPHIAPVSHSFTRSVSPYERGSPGYKE